MRILHVNKFLYRRGGAEAYMLELAELQRRAGAEVAFFAMAHPDNDEAPYAAHFPSHVEMNPAPPGARARATGFGRMMWSTSARRGLARVIADFRPDVAHLHNIYHQLSPSVLAALRDAGVPAVLTLHDYKLVCPVYTLLSNGRICTDCVTGGLRNAVHGRCKDGSLAASAAVAAETWLHRRLGAYGHVSVFISPSRFLAGQMTSAGVYPDRLRIVDHFVAPPSGPGQAALTDRVVYAGRLSPEKGVDVAIRAMGLLPPGARLDIAGDGPERAGLERLADRVAPHRVRFHGRVPAAEVGDLMRAATAVLVPSVWHENQPMTILEAFAAGVPVIASSLGGIPELIQQGTTGLLVPPGDPAALARAMSRLVGDPEAVRRLGRAARAVAATRFAPERHLGAITAVYGAARSVRRGGRAPAPAG